MHSLSSPSGNLYERDYYVWLQATAQSLKNKDWGSVDLQNLIEEIESRGRSEKNALKSNLVIVLLHLLKYAYQPSKRSDSWLNSITEHRIRIELALEESPSLWNYLEEVFENCYTKARRAAATETGLGEAAIQGLPPFTLEQAIDLEFLP